MREINFFEEKSMETIHNLKMYAAEHLVIISHLIHCADLVVRKSINKCSNF